MNPFDYRTLSDLFRQQQEDGTTQAQSVGEYSKQLGEATGRPELFQQGVNDSWIKRGSVGLDRALESTGLPDATAAVGRAALEPFGYGDIGESVGHSLPRTVTNFLPLAAAEVLSGGAATPFIVGALGTAGAGTLAGAGTYTDTGSPAAGLISGLTQGAFANFGGGSLVAKLGEYGAEKLGVTSGLGQYVAHQAAGLGVIEGSGEAESAAQGHGLYNPLNPEHLVSTAAGLLPFAVTDLLKMASGPSKVTTPERVEDAEVAPEQAIVPTTAAPTKVDAFKQDDAISRALTQFGAEIKQNPATSSVNLNLKPEERLVPITVADQPVTTVDEATTKVANASQLLSETGAEPPNDAVIGKALEEEVGKTNDLDKAVTNVTQKLANDAVDHTEVVEQVKKRGRPAIPVETINAQFASLDPRKPEDQAVLGVYNQAARFSPSGGTDAALQYSDNVKRVIASWLQPKTMPDGTVREARFGGVERLQGLIRRQQRGSSAADTQQKTIESGSDRVALEAKAKELNDALPPDSNQFHSVSKAGDKFRLLRYTKAIKTTGEVGNVGEDVKDLTPETQTLVEVNGPKVELSEAEKSAAKGMTNQLVTAARSLDDSFFEDTLPDNIRKKQETMLPEELNDAIDPEDLPRPDLLRNRVVALYSTLVNGEAPEAENVNKYITNKFHQFNSDNAVKAFLSGEVFGHVQNHILETINNEPQGSRVLGSSGGRGTVKEMEKVSAAALRYPDGTIYTGPNHAMAFDAADEGGHGDITQVESGFMTTGGRFVDDKEARQIADANKQSKVIGKPALDSENVKFYGSSGDRGRIPASSSLDYGLQPFENGKVGKHTVSKSGTVTEDWLTKNGGTDNQPLQKGEVDLYRHLVPEAFKDGGINLQTLQDGLKKKGPVVETKTLGDRTNNDAIENTYNQQVHAMDTRWGNDWLTRPPDDPEFRVQRAQLDQVASTRNNAQRDNNVKYSFLGPKPEQNMPGYVEGLVRLPVGEQRLIHQEAYPFQEDSARLKELDKTYPKGRYTVHHSSDFEPGTMNYQSKVKVYENPQKLYEGPHFGRPSQGGHDANVVAFYRGYEETLPTGDKAFHVVEVQTDVVKDNRDGTYSVSNDPENKRFESKNETFNHAAKIHSPLLKDGIWQSMALKAAIAHAQEIGATKLILSDGETAMMTEGHDKTSLGPDGQPAQSGGMRLAYDQTLPSALKKLTGDSGQRVELGTHKTAINEIGPNENETYDNQQDAQAHADRINGTTYEEDGEWHVRKNPVEGSPVFRNPDGTPKSSITGRMFDLSNLTPRASKLFGNKGERGVSGSLTEPNVPNQGLFGAQGLLSQFFKDLPPLQRQSAVETGLKITSALRQNDVAVGELKNDRQQQYNAGLAMLDASGRSGTYLANLLKDGKIGVENAGELTNYVLAHEHTHHVLELPDAALPPELALARKDLTELLTQATPEEHLALIEALRGSGTTVDGITKEGAKNADRGVAANETLANIGATMTMKLVEGDRGWFKDSVAYLPKPVGDFLMHGMEWVRKMASAVMGLAGLGERGVTDVKLSPELLGKGREFVAGLEKFARTKGEIESDVSRFMQLQNMDPVGFGVLQQAAHVNPLFTSGIEWEGPKWAKVAHDDASESFGLKKGKGPLEWMGGLYQKYLLNPSLDVLKNPFTKYGYGIPFQYEHDLSLRSRELQAMLSFDVDAAGNMVESSSALQRNHEIMGDEKLSRAIDDVFRAANESEDGKFPRKEFEKVQSFAGLTKERKADVVNLANTVWNMTRRIQDFTVETHQKMGQIAIGKVLMAMNEGMTSEQARQVSSVFQDGVQRLGDPATAAEGDALLESLKGGMTPESFNEALAFATKDRDRVQMLRDAYKGSPQFTSEQRFNDFLVRYKDVNGESGAIGKDTREDAIAAAKRVVADGGTVIKIADKKDRTQGQYSVPDGTVELLERLEDERNQQLAANPNISPEDLQWFVDQTPLSGMLRQEMAARSVTGFGSNRRLAPGREEIPMLQNQFRYLQAALHGLGKKQARADLGLEMMDPQYKANPEIKQRVGLNMDNVFTPDTKAGKLLSKLNFNYYMAFSLATNLVEGQQSIASHVPGLINAGAGIVEANKINLNSMKTVADWAVSKKWKNPEHDALMRRAGDEVGLGALQEYFGDTDSTMVQIARYAKGLGPVTNQELVKNPLMGLGMLGRSFYSNFTRFNARIALLSSYDFHRSRGLSAEQAQNEAMNFNRQVNFSGGKLNRPVGLFASRTDLGRTATQALYSLQSYNLGMLGTLGHYINEGFRGNVQARKAALSMLGSQAVLAGALGFPGVQLGIALLEQAFPQLELRKSLVGTVQKLTGDDDELGGIFSDVALHGVLNQLGIDMSSRIAFGNSFLGANGFDGFSAANLAGPSYNLMRNAVLGVSQLSQGNIGQGLTTAAPTSIKKLLQLYTNDGQVRSPNGSLLLQPSMGQQFAMAVGFTPTALSKLREAQQIQQRAQQVQRMETGKVSGQAVQAIQQGDYNSARKLLQEYGMSDPSFNPQDAARTIAQQVVERNNPVDVRRTNSNATGIATSLAGIGQLSEVDRLQQQKQIEAGLGLGGTMTPGEYLKAFSVDQQLQMNPRQSVQEARQTVAKATKFQNPFLFGSNP